jgi:zona occludens toxin
LGSSKVKKLLTKEEWIAQMKPRLDGFMWSAPAFDDRKPESQPETYCMAIQGRPCKCISDQGTTIRMEQKQCEDVAVNGVYNPYRKPVDDRWQQQRTMRDDSRQEGKSLQVIAQDEERAGHATGAQVGGHRQLSAAYDANAMAPRTSQY